MPQPRPGPVPPLPGWLVFVASAGIVGHFAAVGALALAAPSGPWLSPLGPSTATGPQFAQDLNRLTAANYLLPLGMRHNYHFPGNRPAPPGVYFEVLLKDDAGRPLEAVRIPDPKANFWVRHRQALLAQWLADDQDIEPRAGEVVAAPNQRVRTVEIWEPSGERTLRLREVPEHLVPRDRQVARPSAWSRLLANAYVRHLCRTQGAASGELVRHFRQPVLAGMIYAEEPPPGLFEEIVSYFGEVKR